MAPYAGGLTADGRAARDRRAGGAPPAVRTRGLVRSFGDTEEQARALDDELDRLIRPEYAVRQLSRTLRIDPERLEPDREPPDDIPTEDEIEGAKSRFTLIVELARRERLTVRQLIGRLGGGRGHRTVAGTAEQVADTIEEWHEAGAADGFNIMPALLPSGLEVFVDRVVPVLQQRGLFRTEYTGRTLREHYGLPRPANRLFETVDTSPGHLGIALTEVS